MQSAARRQLLLRFVAVHEQLAEVVQSKGWERFAAIDVSVRECLQALSTMTEPGEELLRVKQQLKQLYAQAIKACAQACEHLRQSLLTHLEYAEGRSAYLRVDLFQGGR
ncbi:hypothetical protein SAMN04487857_103310 [Pseudomonas sp. ok272]|uniref:hypothetical protein n=1 Tax=unclassified Pseudomonas TaxID=196821 RepID=UPI0008CCFA82|nr:MULTISPECIES: hypothetical protein [unclassified Pseudomonas]SEM63147.1 hypothetical protein SAMN04487857_103310 [Pseudomonas sp. ok272]SFM46910.1 hypothetical protein SAMN04487858_103125 [Pseudomonas sp. ok602]